MDFELYFKEFGNKVFERGGGEEEGGRHSTGYDDSNEPNEPNEPNNVSQEVAVIVDDSPDEDIDALSLPSTEAPKEQPVELENSSNINKNSSPAETTNHQSRLSLKASSLSSLASSSSSSSSSNQNTKVVDGPLPAVPIANDLSITLLSEQGAKRLSQMTGRKYSTITRTIIDYDSKGSIPVVRFEGVE